MIFLGVDGGQSSTTALIGDESGRVIGHGRGGPCNHVKTGDGREKFVNAVTGCLSQAAAEAGLDGPLKFRAACLGFSGGPQDKDAILREIFSADTMTLTNDGMIALSGATNGAPGMIIIAGTGSLAVGRNAAGKVGRAGGWGYIYGDEGSAFDTGRQALRAILRQHEGWGPPTALVERLLAETGTRDANDLLHRFYTPDWPRSRVATLARVVDEVARAGDRIAQGILDRQANELSLFVLAVHRQLFQRGEAVHVAPVGGVWRSERVRGRFQEAVEAVPGVRMAPPVHGPAAGALLDAYRAAGLAVELSNVPGEKA